MSYKSLFIVFEGIDGSGTSTQTTLFGEKIFQADKSHHVLLTREPYDNEYTKKIREKLRIDGDAYLDAEQMADLYIEDRKKHIKDLIKPNLRKGIYVVSDRYKLSTLAYQSAQGLNIDKLITKHNNFPIPDLTFFIDTSVEVALQRSKQDEPKFENQEFQEKTREKYLQTIEKLRAKGEIIYRINGNKNISEVSNSIFQVFSQGLQNNF